jgi:hypothetical protein
MKILVACEFSGIVRDSFTAAGHDALSCDLSPTERPGKHYQGDVLDIIGDGWDMMIAHPPCTYLSRVATRHLYGGGYLHEDRYAMGVEAAEFFMKLYNAPIPRIAIENPVPFLIFDLPKVSQIINPSHFGHSVSKKTCLWLKNLPPLMSTYICANPETTKKRGGWFNILTGSVRAAARSRTFQGIADAMAEQWGKL